VVFVGGTLTWRGLRFVSSQTLFKVSWIGAGAIILLPQAARLFDRTDNSFQSLALRIFDTSDADFPLNMSRAFWTLLLTCLGHLLFQWFSPAPIRYATFADWRRSSDAEQRCRQLVDQRKSEAQIEAELSAYHLNFRETYLTPRSIPLVLAWFTILIAGWLIALVLADHIALMAREHSWRELLAWPW